MAPLPPDPASAPATATGQAARDNPPTAEPGVTVRTPTVRRRLMAMLYDTLLIAAVQFCANFVFIVATGNRQTPLLHALGVALFFLVGAAYFLHAWCGSGFTLAMKTWRIKLVKPGHARVPFGAALLRHVLAWGWVLPALFIAHAAKLTHGQSALALLLGVLAWAATALLDPGRQFLHDRLAGTRLIALPKPSATRARASRPATPPAQS